MSDTARETSEDGLGPRSGFREQALESPCGVSSTPSARTPARSSSATKASSGCYPTGSPRARSSRSRGRASRCSAAASRPRAPWSSTLGPTRAIAAPSRRGRVAVLEHGTGDLGAVYAGFSETLDGDERRWSRTAESYARLAGLCLAQSAALASALSRPDLDALTGCLSYAGSPTRSRSRSSARAATATGSAVASSTSTASSGSTTSTVTCTATRS